MDPRFRSSFIPKNPVATKDSITRPKRKKVFDPINFFASLLFIASLAVSGGIYAYTQILQDDINVKGARLAEARALLDPYSAILEYKLLDERLRTTLGLVRNHKKISTFFATLETQTLHNIMFNTFKFKSVAGVAALEVTITGEATDFNALALQADVFEQQEILTGVAFETLLVVKSGPESSESDRVGFTIVANLNPELIKYITVQDRE